MAQAKPSRTAPKPLQRPCRRMRAAALSTGAIDADHCATLLKAADISSVPAREKFSGRAYQRLFAAELHDIAGSVLVGIAVAQGGGELRHAVGKSVTQHTCETPHLPSC